MRLTIILLLTIISASASGQRLTGKYNAYYGHSLELKSDSTFRYEWMFDLASSWAVGQWTVSEKMVYLKFKDIYDTLTREGKPDSLVLSADDVSSKIEMIEFLSYQLSSGRQGHAITDRLAIRRNKLYQMDKDGRILRTKQSGIMTKKKRPTYYFKVG